ncbi:MAG: formylglycine-generating enzyme family protein [Nitrospirota bacterium]
MQSVRVQLLIAVLAVAAIAVGGGYWAARTIDAPSAADRGMILIPAGEFLMGSDRVDTEGRGNEFGFAKPLYLDEHPQQPITLPDFRIDRYEVTQSAYAAFVRTTGEPAPEHWTNGVPPAGTEQRPVTGVDWFQAQRYCEWRGKRLPTETEWEKAARGADGREFPWGNDYDGKKANTGDANRGGLVDVGSFPDGRSPYGVEDMAGNAWEWTSDWYLPHPGSSYHSDQFGRTFKVLKGGGWGGVGHYALPEFYRSAYRFPKPPIARYRDFGFRCAQSVS